MKKKNQTKNKNKNKDLAKIQDKKKTTKTIRVDYLARVEGEGALHIDIEGDQVKDVKLKIFEPPRFFEALLRGRSFQEAPDITARICGICPVAYQMSSVYAMEQALGLQVSQAITDARRLLYCGEWIESHVLHIYMLHAPDFLGYEDAIQLAKDYPKIVERGLQLKKVGNEIIRILGGREIHPINVKVGGFYKFPEKGEMNALLEKLKWALLAAEETINWVSTFSFPDLQMDYDFVSLYDPNEYPMNPMSAEGAGDSVSRVVASGGSKATPLNIAIRDYENYFEELHVPYTNALHSVRKGLGAYFVGPMARFFHNSKRLPPRTLELVQSLKLGVETCKNPFQSILIRAVEVHFACEEAISILQRIDLKAKPAHDIQPSQLKNPTGIACTEAPRGILYHRYQINQGGIIEEAKIVPPTSQNQKMIESDLRELVKKSIHLSNEKLTWICEQAVRNYDPCISCATHFLKLKFNHEPA